MDEQWQTISGWPYEVSSHGRIRRSVAGRRTRVGRVRKPQQNRYGYQTVVLSRTPEGGRQEIKTFRIHDAVARAFIGPRPYKAQINHIDGDKANNRADNLEYVTASENQQHAVANGLFADQKGEANPASKLTTDDVVEIRRQRREGRKLKEIASAFHVSVPAISAIINRKTWRHIE